MNKHIYSLGFALLFTLIPQQSMASEGTFILSRIQFALNMSFHILFPSITIGLAWLLFYFKLRYDLSKNPVWMRIYRFWVKIFALSFALGVVSGITMSFQFGTNWPGFMEKVGNIAGPLLGYEVLSAFFLEATFLGIMLFGLRRVPNSIHTLATLLVAIGTSLSAFWIIALNSWMHTPSGFEMRDGIAFPVDWVDIIFNPSMPYRLAHVYLASALTALFLIAGISSYRILRGDTKKAPRLALKTSLIFAACLCPLQIFLGDLHGLNTLKHQPQKIAAIEGAWETDTHVPLLLFALPNEDTQSNDFEIGIPGLASFILTHSFEGEVKGLRDFKHRPRSAPLFFGFRLMVSIGLGMLVLAWIGSYYSLRKKRLPKGLLRALYYFSFSGWLATLAGWYVTEMGRQPYVVNGLVFTRDVVTDIAPSNVVFSLTLFASVYLLLLVAYLHTVFYMARKAVDIEEFQSSEVTVAVTPQETHA